MRGFLHPQVTGSYRFWIASDNSSELWLSTDADPSKARKIATVPRFDYVNPREWSRYPSQRSEPIQLTAGETYYIEALQEQTEGGDNLSVGWQEPQPGKSISVIEGRYLTPWGDARGSSQPATNGILREFWTNFSAGDLSGVGGARPFESILTVKEVGIQVHGKGEFPKPDRIALNQPLQDKDNYRWVEVEGMMKFKATDGHTAFLELSDGQTLIQVRALHWNPAASNLDNVGVRIEGVCEGIYDQERVRMPGVVWASAENSVSFTEAGKTNTSASAMKQSTSTAVADQSGHARLL